MVGQFAQMTTDEHDTAKKHAIQGNQMVESSPRGTLQASPATGVETNFNDSGFCDCEEDRISRRYVYEDWILFPGEIPPVSTDNFFADLDRVNREGLNNESTVNLEREAVYRAQNHRSTTFYDPVHEAARQAIHHSVYEAIDDFEVRLQPNYSRPSYEAPIAGPFQKWYSTHEKHESLAYRLSQPSTLPRSQHSRQPSQPSGHESRTR
jgi:hypothetical protein